jgi:tetratricopeptide (TPR) repeat protein
MSETTGGFGAYTLESIFMQSADGLMYRAEHTATGGKVLIFVPHMPEEWEEIAGFRDRFLESARRAEGLRHDGILAVREIGVEAANGIPFVAYEAADGHDVRELSGHGRRLADTDIALLGAVVAEALDHAHTHGLLHGDLSPESIIFGEGGVVKLWGFAIEGAAKSPTGMRGFAPGTGSYSSPEQIIGGAVDGRSDLFSLGIVLFELVTGEHPFTAVPPRDARDRIVADEAPLAGKVRPDAPGGFNSILFKMLQKDPSKRPASAAEAAESLRALHVRLAQPPPAPAAAAPPRPQAAPARRGPSVAVIAGGGGVLVLAAAVAAVVFLRPPARPVPAPGPSQAVQTESPQVAAALADVEAAVAAGDFTKAERMLAELRRLDPLNARGLELAQKLRAARDQKVARLFDEGVALARAQRWAEAERRFSDVLAIDPDNVDAKDQIEEVREMAKSSRMAGLEAASPRQAQAVQIAPTAPPPRIMRVYFASPLPAGELVLALDRRPFATIPFDFSNEGGSGIVDRTFEMPHGRHQVLVALHNQQGLTLGDGTFVLDFEPGHTFQLTATMSSARSAPRFRAGEIR